MPFTYCSINACKRCFDRLFALSFPEEVRNLGELIHLGDLDGKLTIVVFDTDISTKT